MVQPLLDYPHFNGQRHMHTHAIAQVKIKGHKTKSHEVGGGLVRRKREGSWEQEELRGWWGEYDKNICMYIIVKE